MIVTVQTAKDKDWFHKPSEGWNYTLDTLKELIDLDPNTPSNFDEYERISVIKKQSKKTIMNQAGQEFRIINSKDQTLIVFILMYNVLS